MSLESEWLDLLVDAVIASSHWVAACAPLSATDRLIVGDGTGDQYGNLVLIDGSKVSIAPPWCIVTFAAASNPRKALGMWGASVTAWIDLMLPAKLTGETPQEAYLRAVADVTGIKGDLLQAMATASPIATELSIPEPVMAWDSPAATGWGARIIATATR